MSFHPGKLRGKAIDVSLPLCFLNKHSPDRRAAKWDGFNYVSYCEHCAKKIRRKARNDWRRDWVKSDRRSTKRRRRTA